MRDALCAEFFSHAIAHSAMPLKKGYKMSRVIYFIQAGPGGPIKIGVATNTAERLNALQTGSPYPLMLLAECAGDIAQERALHAELAEFRMAGEWFSPSPEVFAVVDEAKTFGIWRTLAEKAAPAAVPLDDSFVRRTFLAALKIAYPNAGREQQIARDGCVTVECARNWLNRGRLPHTAQLINLSSQNIIMHAWLQATLEILRRALETGTTPEQALMEMDREAA